MCDHWMPTIKLSLTIEQFHELPRHPAYKYEYLAGQAWLTPRSKHYHAILDLKPLDVPVDATLRHVEDSDWPDLHHLFSAAFHRTQPYGSLDEPTRMQAAEEALERTRTGGDGPWIRQASFVALEDANIIGAVFVTLLPKGDLCDWDSYHWTAPPPPDCIERRQGNAHLTWIFVAPLLGGQGTGSVLLAAAVRELIALGYTQLVSTFMLGNDASMLWHWRNGFQLLSYPGSFRLMKERWKRK
ncbi:MAG: GNAT family N-acetyltransferase [Gemmataceae bacterium]|nr:GNAT family N-acetyltransferase [Gemmataceae bacterium]